MCRPEDVDVLGVIQAAVALAVEEGARPGLGLMISDKLITIMKPLDFALVIHNPNPKALTDLRMWMSLG
jgi:hypothetical protein